MSQLNRATGKTQMAYEASAYAVARGKDGSLLTPEEEEREAVHVQLSADAAVVSVCAEKIREAERERDIARAERDTAEARVKDLEIRLRDMVGAKTLAV